MLLGIAFRRQGDEHARDGRAARPRWRRSSGWERSSTRSARRSCSGESRRAARSSSPTSSTRRGCSRPSATSEVEASCSPGTTSSFATRIVESGGEVIKQTGDGFFASFDDPEVRQSRPPSAIQRALARRGRRARRQDRRARRRRVPARARASATTAGQGVHVAARIGAAAGAGEILVSRETLDGVATSFRLSEPRAELAQGLRAAGRGRLGRLALDRSARASAAGEAPTPNAGFKGDRPCVCYTTWYRYLQPRPIT